MNIKSANNFMTGQNIDYNKNTKNKSSLQIPKENLKKALDDYSINISDEAKALLAEEKALEQEQIQEEKNQELKRKMEEEARFKEELLRQHESSLGENPYEAMTKCLQIAMRIISGDTVPKKDEQFLLENEPGMYSNSMLLRRQKDDPKEFKTLLEDEEDDSEELIGSLDVSMKGPTGDTDIEVSIEE